MGFCFMAFFVTKKIINIDLNYILMYYEIVRNHEALVNFVDFLPDNTEEEKYLIFLFSRKKYNQLEGLTADRCQLKRLLVNKKDIINELYKLEVKQGLFKFEDIVVPQENLVVYIQPNPRSMRKAARLTVTDGLNNLLDLRSLY